MKQISRPILVICLLIPFLSCAQNKQSNTGASLAEYHKISAEEAKKMLDTNHNIILLDVRSEEEYKAMHIPGATLLPLPEIGNKAVNVLPDKNAVILVYCRSGARSRNASNQLVSMGYSQIYDIEGGISNWPYKTESN